MHHQLSSLGCTLKWRLTAISSGRHISKRWKATSRKGEKQCHADPTCNSQVMQGHCISDPCQTKAWIYQHCMERTDTGQDALTGVCAARFVCRNFGQTTSITGFKSSLKRNSRESCWNTNPDSKIAWAPQMTHVCASHGPQVVCR